MKIKLFGRWVGVSNYLAIWWVPASLFRGLGWLLPNTSPHGACYSELAAVFSHRPWIFNDLRLAWVTISLLLLGSLPFLLRPALGGHGPVDAV